jgi:hypothetical protein
MTSFDPFKKYINSWCGGQKCTCSACRIQPVLPHTVLSENDVLITKQDEVCEIFNNFFVNVAKNIGNNKINVDGDHPSILEIKNNHPELLENSFCFSSVNPDFVEKRINKINVKKATGIDGISPKLLHFAKPIIVKPLTDIVNYQYQYQLSPTVLRNLRSLLFIKRIVF